MKIKKSITVKATPEKVWEILGPNYAHAGAWVSSIYVSGPRDGAPKIAGAPVLGRVCQTSLGPVQETIEAYDDSRRHVAYSATAEKMPGFIKSLANAWTVHPDGGHSRVDLDFDVDIAFPFNVLMGPIMRLQFSKVLREALDDLKHYAESGTPHPRKIKVDGTKKAAAARAAFS